MLCIWQAWLKVALTGLTSGQYKKYEIAHLDSVRTPESYFQTAEVNLKFLIVSVQMRSEIRLISSISQKM